MRLDKCEEDLGWTEYVKIWDEYRWSSNKNYDIDWSWDRWKQAYVTGGIENHVYLPLVSMLREYQKERR